MPFSRATIMSLVELFGRSRQHADWDKDLLKLGLEDVAPQSVGGLNKREAALAAYLIRNAGIKGPSGANLTLELLEVVLADQARRTAHGAWPLSSPAVDQQYAQFCRLLEQDGYQVVDGRLQRTIPAALAAATEPDAVEKLLDLFNFTVPKGHLEQGRASHARSDWAAANAQFRTYVESLFDDIAVKLDPAGAAARPTSQGRRELLAQLSPPFLSIALNEWELGNSGGFVQGFFRRLHPQGSHPGLSDEQDSTFRLHLVLLVTGHMLRRLQIRLGL